MDMILTAKAEEIKMVTSRLTQTESKYYITQKDVAATQGG